MGKNNMKAIKIKKATGKKNIYPTNYEFLRPRSRAELTSGLPRSELCSATGRIYEYESEASAEMDIRSERPGFRRRRRASED